MKNLDDKVRKAKEAGYDNAQIVDFLSQSSAAPKIEQARSAGYSHDDIIRHLAGEKRGVVERLKQGMAGAYLGTAQMGAYLGEKTGLGDIVLDSEGLRRVSPEESRQRREKIEGGIKELNIEKGDAGLGASLVSAAGDPTMWAGAGFGGSLIKQGLQSGALYEALQPQEGEFDPTKKAKDVAITSAISGAAAPVAGKLIDVAAKYSPTSLATKGVQNVVSRVKGIPPATARAASRVQELVADPIAAASKITDDSISGLSPARQSGESGLIGLEDAARKTSPEIEKGFAEREMRSREILSREAGGIGEGVSPSRATEFIEGRREKIVEKLNAGVAEAERKAGERLSALGNQMRESDAAIVVREELEKSLKNARFRERFLWYIIPRVGLTTAGIKSKFREIMQNTPKAQMDDVPQVAKDLLGKTGGLKNIEKLSELQGLRSKLLEESRKARAAGEYNKARIADDLADAILDDLGAQAGNIRGKAGEALRRALDYSRQLNETYRQGNVGRVLGTARAGDDRIAAELTLRSTIGGGGVRGGVAVNELMQAAPQSAAGIRDYVLQSFNKAAVKEGVLNEQASNKFLRDNADILDRFPDVRQSIGDAIAASSTLASKQARAQRVTNDLFTRQKSAAADYLGSPVDKEFARILSSKNPMALAGELRKMAAKDPSGEALSGLKTGAVEYLMTKASSGADNAGNAIVSGNKLKQLLKDSRTGGAVANLLKPDEMRYLSQIADELSALEMVGTNLNKVIDAPAPNKLMTIAARVLGAKAGAKLGGGNAGASLQSAQIGSANAKEYLNKFVGDKAEELIIQSVHDKTLRDLLTANISTPAKQVEVAKKLSDWATLNKGFFVSPVVSFGVDEKERQSEPLKINITPKDKLPEPVPDGSLPNIAPQSSNQNFFDAVKMAESSGNPNAQAATSSASGLYQFTDQTWKDSVNKWGGKYGITEADKNNPQAQEAMVRELTIDNARILANKIGREPSDGDLYIAHVFGAGAGAKMINSLGSNKMAYTIARPADVRANKSIFFKNGKASQPRTVDEVYALLTSKVS